MAIIKNTIYSLLAAILLLACSSSKKEKIGEASQQTPEVLQGPASSSSTRVLSQKARYKKDLIQALFEEALEKDTQLQKLDQEYQAILQAGKEVKIPIQKYQANMRSYWKGSENYINRIQDSIVQDQVKKLFSDFQDKFESDFDPLLDTLDSLDGVATSLKDQMIICKLFVTSHMIYNYWNNELPKRKPLDSLRIQMNLLREALREKSNFKK